MTVATMFRVTGDLVSCPDPEYAEWEYMSPPSVSLVGRIIQQGRLRCTLHWGVMSGGDFSDLLEVWNNHRSEGYMITDATLPPYNGDDNTMWQTVSGTAATDGKIRMMMPKGTRKILEADDVSVVFEDIEPPSFP